MRRGSALLIVLGMLSFLVMSAVAFSAYMRYARLPSSYLLRMSSSRNLVKAGLVRAIDALDGMERGIGNDPHPGVPTGQTGRNVWYDRVFYGTNTVVETGSTVSTLTLEGLAYVPAPLINSTRYHARRTPTAVWHQMGFDSGRYAFTVVDVSDYFDVHRLVASAGRTSAADGRVSIAHLFEDRKHSGQNWLANAKAWDAFMDAFVDESGGGSKLPLVSLADLHLALWDSGPANLKEKISPWCRFIKNGTEFARDDADERHAQSNMVFVTDSWYPPAREEKQGFNLASGDGQPFLAALDLRNPEACASRGFDEIMRGINGKKAKDADGGDISWSNILAPIEAMQLCDYLDADSVPTTLCMPTTERVPMVAGVALKTGSALKLVVEKTQRSAKQQGGGQGGGKGSTYEITCYKLRLTGELLPMVAAVYPFKHRRGSEDNATYQVQVAATIAFVPKGSETKLRRADAAEPLTLAWADEKLEPAVVACAGGGDCKSVVVLRSDLKNVTVNRNPVLDTDCVSTPVELPFGAINADFSSKLPAVENVPDSANDVGNLRVIEKVDNQSGQRTLVAVTKGFQPVDEALAKAFAEDPAAIEDSAEFVPVIQLGVRIIDSEQRTVDLMPACPADDAVRSDLLPDLLANGGRSHARERPFLRFACPSGTLKVSREWFEAAAKKSGGATDIIDGLSPAAYVANDPRLNHAPEDLMACPDVASPDLGVWWLAHVTAPAFEVDETTQHDIFMATSDAGYLQSKYELAYLLRIVGLDTDSLEDVGVLGSAGYNGEIRTSFADVPGRTVMWNAYAPWSVGGGQSDIDDLPVASGGGGQKICPYTPDVPIMMGALANTPIDWWAASTNDDTAVKQQMLGDLKESLKYTFSQYAENASTKVEWSALEDMARTLINGFRSGNGDWETTYENLSWTGNLLDNLESDDVILHGVDRRFLYGYWHDCFESRQQLFLVFVRTEPMMLGGEAVGALPPMLGARAVAVVWRDPAPTKNGAPHRMRILFYRQFD